MGNPLNSPSIFSTRNLSGSEDFNRALVVYSRYQDSLLVGVTILESPPPDGKIDSLERREKFYSINLFR